MSTSMIAKLATAAAMEHERLTPKLRAGVIDANALWQGVAAKTLAALREPTPEMSIRAHDIWQGGGRGTDIWRGMVDAARGADTFQV